MTDLPKKGIAITGCGRSGTSFLIKALHANGVSVGRCTGGTLENLEVRAINDSYLANNFKAIKNSQKPYGVLPDDEISVNAEAQQNSKQVINNLKSISPNYWAFKDPRTTVLHDMWVKHCDIIIGVFRNPVEVVQSYMKLLDIYYLDNKEEGYVNMLNYWKRFNKSLLHVFKNSDKPKYMIDFNGDVENQIDILFNELNIEKIHFDYDKNKKEQNSDSIYEDSDVINIYEELKKLSMGS